MTEAIASLFVRKLQADAEYYARHPEEIDLMFADCCNEAAQIEAINRGDRDAIDSRV